MNYINSLPTTETLKVLEASISKLTYRSVSHRQKQIKISFGGTPTDKKNKSRFRLVTPTDKKKLKIIYLMSIKS